MEMVAEMASGVLSGRIDFACAEWSIWEESLKVGREAFANVLDVAWTRTADSYHDEQVRPGGTYTYRIAYVSNRTVLAYSNPVTVIVPAPSLSLSGEMLPDGMHLKWHMSGGANVDSWAILVSKSISKPGYPGWVYDRVSYSGSSGSYTVYKADPNTICYYRVAALSGGIVVSYSNTITYYPPTLR